MTPTSRYRVPYYHAGQPPGWHAHLQAAEAQRNFVFDAHGTNPLSSKTRFEQCKRCWETGADIVGLLTEDEVAVLQVGKSVYLIQHEHIETVGESMLLYLE